MLIAQAVLSSDQLLRHVVYAWLALVCRCCDAGALDMLQYDACICRSLADLYMRLAAVK
jgi:hypothetical protein